MNKAKKMFAIATMIVTGSGFVHSFINTAKAGCTSSGRGYAGRCVVSSGINTCERNANIGDLCVVPEH